MICACGRWMPAGEVSGDVRAATDAVYDALHEAIDGDYLVGASGWQPGADVAVGEARVSEVVRWATTAVAPLLAEARAAVERVEALARIEAMCDDADLLYAIASPVGAWLKVSKVRAALEARP